MRFKKKSKETSSAVEAPPQLTARVFHGNLEKEESRQRHEWQFANRKYKKSAFRLFDENRQNIQRSITSGFSRQIYGGFWIRLLAYSFDWMIVQLLIFLCVGIIDFFLSEPLVVTSSVMDYLVRTFILIIYFTISSYVFNGQTLGKILCDLQVINDNETRVSMKTCFIREGLGKFILSTIPLLGIVVIFTPKRESFIDLFMDTNVIALKQFRLIMTEEPF